MEMSMDKAIGSASVRLSKKLTRYINLQLKPFSITTEQWSVLRTLSESNDISQKELSERADKDQATLTKILDLLEKNKFIERVQNPSDRRSFLIKITQKGAQLVKEVTPYLEEVFAKITDSIQAEKLAIYKETVLSLENNIEMLLEENKQKEG
ncbi:MarR family winged helix-turn-helix transcriptional regulator [Heyndrickxia sp. MSNUG]|uniref:MarR family winged helix-turn-helix transcriptional regulator n=1 Tax=Heyndrickxia sp. MSNUG TaxID=3136677 RepID=UPI003C2B35F6